MIQGGHFLSDVLWAGVITYLVGQFLYYVFRFDEINYT
jgi:membrane-associated PAP2 superfamily phosphatase